VDTDTTARFSAPAKKEEVRTMDRSERILSTFAVLIVLLLLLALRPASAGDDWLPVSPEDLALKDNPKSLGAHAMILYRESSVDANEASTNEYVRIKIFTQEGTKEGDVEVPFVKGSEVIKDISARTIRPDGTIVRFEGKPFEKTVVKSGGFRFLAKEFVLPDVKPGCIIEYKYRIQRDPLFYFDTQWVIQGELFTRLARFSIKPGDHSPPLLYRTHGLPANTVPQKQPHGYLTLEVHDLPGIEEEELMMPESILKARVEFFYKSRWEPLDETSQEYWKRVGKTWSEWLDEFVNKKGALSSELSRTVSDRDPPDTKLREIYARVLQFRNLSMEDEKTSKEVKQEKLKDTSDVGDVLKHGYANGRQINCLFIGLARAAGFSATQVFVAPRNMSFFAPDIMDSNQLNVNLVWIRAGGQDYYLDPGARYFPFGVLPWYESGTTGIRVGKEGGTMVETPAPLSSGATIVRHAQLEIGETGAVTGNLQVDFTGQRAALRREEDRDEDETGRKKEFEDEVLGWLPAGSTYEITKIDNWDNIELPVHVEGTVKISDFATSAGQRILVPVTIFQASEPKAFQAENRSNAVYFHFPYQETDDVRFKVPAGYKIEAVPPPIPATPSVITYEVAATQQGDTIEVKRHLDEQGIMFDVKYYPALRAFFSRVKSNDNAQIVFQPVKSSERK
jgi:hypothetical protein